MLKKYWPQFLIILTVALLSWLNYTPGTFLSGWDTLHPEFDFPLNFSRLLSGVWREEQGLGAIAGHSHMADLPRVFILWILHFVFPLSSLRYLYIFLSLALGLLGIYYLIQHLLKNKNIAFLSALFYLFNASTLQQFYVPFEMFPTQYAALPWIILFSLRFLQNPSRKWLFLFAVVTLLSTPQAYAAHLWYAFFGVYLLFIISYVLLNSKNGWRSFGDPTAHSESIRSEHWRGKNSDRTRAIILVSITLLINSFWLLPNLYYIATSTEIPRFAKQNRIFSQEYRLRNREHGYLQDVSLVKGFYFNWTIYDFEKDRFVYLMRQWRDHFSKPVVPAIGYLFFTFVLLGLLLACRKKDREFLPFFPFFLIPFILLMNHTFPFDRFFDFLLRFSVFEEALRFVFTKLSILLIFSYTIYLAYFLHLLFSYKFITRYKLPSALILISALVFYMLPVFQGNLISEKVRIKIPQEYFSFWTYMKTQPDGKVLSLPLYNFPGWQYYNFGYQGAGFDWFGLKQPILDRDFDRWSVANEQAFRELHYAVYSRNSDLFDKSIQKYDIRYLLWDKNVISPSLKNRKQIIYEREIQEIFTALEAQNRLQKIAEFNNLLVFEVGNKQPDSPFVKISRYVSPPYLWNSSDFAYEKETDYVSGENGNIYYPFRDILTVTDRVNKNFFDINEDTRTVFLNLRGTTNQAIPHIPDFQDVEDVVFVNLSVRKTGERTLELTLEPILPKTATEPLVHTIQKDLTTNVVRFSINGQIVRFNQEVLESETPVYVGELFIFTKRQNFIDGVMTPLEFASSTPSALSPDIITKIPLQTIVVDAEQIVSQNNRLRNVKLKDGTLVFQTRDAQEGVSVDLSTLPHNLGYLLLIESQHNSGIPLRICVKNLYSNICSFYDELSRFERMDKDYFLIPPAGDGLGYYIFIDNISYGNYDSKNLLEKIQIIPFPYSFLSQMYFSTPGQDEESQYYTLNQTFHPGWRAYINGKKLKNHVLVNNWANGWKIDKEKGERSKEKVIFIFWPQYLEYLGFLLVFASFLFIVKFSRN